MLTLVVTRQKLIFNCSYQFINIPLYIQYVDIGFFLFYFNFVIKTKITKNTNYFKNYPKLMDMLK